MRAMPTITHAIPATPAEFLAWKSRKRQREELVKIGRLVTGGAVGHSVLARRFVAALDRQFRSGCSASQSGITVISPTGMVTYPNVMVRCGAFDEDARNSPLA